MLDIVYLILHILLAIILILIILLLMLLLLPFTYRINGSANDKDISIRSSLSWLFKIIYISFIKVNEISRVKVKVLGITVFNSDKSKSKPKEDEDKQKEKKEKPKGIKAWIEKIKNIYKNIKEIITTIFSDVTKRAFKYFKKVTIGLLKHIRPRKITGNILFGFEEPHLTGQTLGYIAIAYNILKINPKDIKIEADFEKKIFKGKFKVKGRFLVGVVLIDLLKLYMNRDIKFIIDKFSKEA